MTKPSLFRLRRFVQQLGLEAVVPILSQASYDELHAMFATLLWCLECHKDLGIAENFKPTMLPSVPFTDVKNATEDIRSPRYHEDSRSPLMDPYFSTIAMEEMVSLTSYDPQRISLIEPPLKSDDFLGCRVFFRIVVEAVEQGFRIVVLNNEEHTVLLGVHIKALRMLKTSPDAVQIKSKEALLLQVEYYFMSTDDTNTSAEDLKILSDLVKQYPKGKTRIALGTIDHIYFVRQIFQAHERLLDKTVISEHDEGRNARQKNIRPSFIVPILTLKSVSPHLRREIFEKVYGVVFPTSSESTPSERAQSENKNLCAACGKTNVKLKVCSACKLIKYCTRECQASDWQSHKQTCRAMGSNLN